jgi:cyclophilin family peptidyl-prolyl cis-trans isomerase/protein-disulfide isomerase
MSKKLLFLLLVGMLIISACSGKTEQATSNPVETQEIVASPTPTATIFVDPKLGEPMPCTTAMNYPTTEEANYYQAIVDQLEPVTDQDWIYGNPDAPITIMEYADFQCPACPRSVSYKGLVDQYPDSIRFVFRHLPLFTIHDKAYLSSMAAEAAGAQDPDKFWELHDIMYIYQQQWSSLTEDEFIDWISDQAATLGLDVDQFLTDLNDKDVRKNMEEETEARLAMGVNYTPFMIINDRIYQDNRPDLFGLVGIYEFGGYEECPPWVIEDGKSYRAKLDTSVGMIEIELFAEDAPLAVNSFVFLAQEGWFDDIYFHRVVEDFVAQAGDPSGLGYIGPGYTFANETNGDLSYDSAGVVGMANAGTDTNGSQFFITLAPATQLDGGYTIFGVVTEESLLLINEIAMRDPATAVGFDDATVIYGIEIIEN